MSAYRILIVEDEMKLLQHLVTTLSGEDFSTFTCSSFRELEAVLQLPIKRYDVIVLDRMLHGQDTAELVPEIKKEIPSAKIMVLSAINSSAEKVSLLDKGADDYLAKPFDSEELVARIRVLLRRSGVDLQLGNVVLDSVQRTIKIGDAEVQVPNKEFILLRTLMQAPGKIFNKNYLYEQVWEMSIEVESNVVETTVNKLRRRLKEAGADVQIKNSRNVGYWIEV